jgi:hypothetical protein
MTVSAIESVTFRSSAWMTVLPWREGSTSAARSRLAADDLASLDGELGPPQQADCSYQQTVERRLQQTRDLQGHRHAAAGQPPE